MEKNKNKHHQDTSDNRSDAISKVLKLRKKLNLPTDEHHQKFFQNASLDEIKEILIGLEELALIFGNLERVSVGLD